MKRALLILLVACSSKEQPQEKTVEHSAPAPRPSPPPKNRLAKVTTTAPLEITNVSFLPLGTMSGPIAGEYSASWKASREGAPAQIGAHVKCRVHDRNLVTLYSAGNPENAGFYPDPYDGAAPEACEVRWYDKQGGAILARACFRAGELTDGACPPATFLPPSLPPGMLMDFAIVPTPKRFEKPVPLFQLDARSVRMNAVATLGTQLTARPLTILRCQDGTTVTTTDEPQAFVDLQRLEPGETIYGWNWFFTLDDGHGLTKLERCELQFFTGDPKGKPAGTMLGTFCIQQGEVPTTTPGACTPPIPPAKKKPKK